MNGLDEIRYINRLKKRGVRLSPYQQWVIGERKTWPGGWGKCPRTPQRYKLRAILNKVYRDPKMSKRTRDAARHLSIRLLVRPKPRFIDHVWAGGYVSQVMLGPFAVAVGMRPWRSLEDVARRYVFLARKYKIQRTEP